MSHPPTPPDDGEDTDAGYRDTLEEAAYEQRSGDEDTDGHDRASDPPGAVSNQNGEEAESELRPDATHPEPRTTEESGDGAD
jgi:hypothetical protein